MAERAHSVTVRNHYVKSVTEIRLRSVTKVTKMYNLDYSADAYGLKKNRAFHKFHEPRREPGRAAGHEVKTDIRDVPKVVGFTVGIYNDNYTIKQSAAEEHVQRQQVEQTLL